MAGFAAGASGSQEMMRRARLSRSQALAVKRGIDVVGAGVGLILLSPLLVGTAVAIRVVEGKPILFRHVRPGLHGRPFTLVKFRTMRDPHPGEVWYLTDEQRVSRLGRFLRSSSIDELPELWNVLRGDMSLVGPRPLLTEYLEQYTPEQHKRHDMRPGFTGWAAVNGRHTAKFEERLALDVWYVEHWSLGLDFRILARTVMQVVFRSDVSTTQDPAVMGAPLPGVEGVQLRPATPTHE
ncbi:MAG TPA: sugar transferase [Actinomycetota bacterium]|nr:sugar transferase [Actinomycetota bacterium]